MWMIIMWVSIFAVLTVIEFITFQFISIWFAVAAIVSMICAITGQSFAIQLIAFFASSILLLILTRPIYKKVHNSPIIPTNVDREIGKIATVIEDIDNETAKGRVKVEGIDWSARSVNGEKITTGQNVVIKDIEGTKLFVDIK